MRYTLGTPSWRNVELDSQISISRLKDPIYVNGALHWIMLEGSILCSCFGNHSNGYIGLKHITMGELKELFTFVTRPIFP